MSNTAKCGNKRTNERDTATLDTLCANYAREQNGKTTTTVRNGAQRTRGDDDDDDATQQNDDDSGCVWLSTNALSVWNASFVCGANAHDGGCYARCGLFYGLCARSSEGGFVLLCAFVQRGENTILYSFYFESKRATRAKRGRQLHCTANARNKRDREATEGTQGGKTHKTTKHTRVRLVRWFKCN